MIPGNTKLEHMELIKSRSWEGESRIGRKMCPHQAVKIARNQTAVFIT